MDKLFCFYCQEDVKPSGFWKLKFCPKCHQRLTDDGSGFYKVCDVCGANLPTDAKKCMHCGYNFVVEDAIADYQMGQFFSTSPWAAGFLAFLVLLACVAFILCILYVSIYFAAIAVILALIFGLYNLIRMWLHL